MIPDGIREMSPAENGVSSAGVEDATQNEMAIPTDTCIAVCNEEEAQMSIDKSGGNEITESGRQETAEEDSCISHQPCLTSSEVPPSSSEVASECNIDCDSIKQDDDLASSDRITDGGMKPSFQDADDEKVSEDDRQPTNAVAEQTEVDDSHPTEADTCHDNMPSEIRGAETNTSVTAEEYESRVGHLMFKHLLDSDTDNHNEDVVSQQQSVEQAEPNDNEQIAKDTGKTGHRKLSVEEMDTSAVGDKENVLEENARCELVTNEYVGDESSDEETKSEIINRGDGEAEERNEEPIRNEEAEQLSGTMPEETSELLRPMEESSAETGTNLERDPERNVHMPETPVEANEMHQQVTHCTTNEKSDLASYHPDENVHVEQPHLADNRMIEQNATEETMVNSTNVCSRRSSEGDKSPEPTAETESTEQILQPSDTSVDKKESFVVDSIQPAESHQLNRASEPVEEAEEVGTKNISCSQSNPSHLTNASEYINERFHKNSSDDIETEHSAASTKNTEDNVEAIEVEDKAPRLAENDDSNQNETNETTDETESGQNQCDAADKIEKSTENRKEVHKVTGVVTEKPDEQPDSKFDKGVEETGASRSLYTYETCSSSAANTEEHCDENSIYGEVGRNFQVGSRRTPVTSDTAQCEPHGVDHVSAQEESYNAEEAQEEVAEGNEDMQGLASETCETYKIEIVTQQNNTTELWTDNRVTETVGEESLMVNHVTEKLAEEEMTKTTEIKENTENRNSADVTEQQSIKETKQNEPATETETPHITNDPEVNEAVSTVNEFVVYTSKEVSVGNNQPHRCSLNSEELENESKSKNAMDESSAIKNDMCETIEQAVEHSTTEEDTQQHEMAVEQQAHQSKCTTEMATEQLERKAPVDNKSLSAKEMTENHEGNDKNEQCVENPNKHCETDSPRTAEVAEQLVNVPETDEDRASSTAVEPCDKNTMEFKGERMVELETEIERPTEAAAAGENTVTESATPLNDNCASDTSDVQLTEIPQTADNMDQNEAGYDQQDRQENNSPVSDGVKVMQEQLENTSDDEHVRQTELACNDVDSDVAEKTNINVASEHNLHEDTNVQKAHDRPNEAEDVNEAHSSTDEAGNSDQHMAEQNEVTDRDPISSQAKTTPQAEVAASCSGTVKSILDADVDEVRKTERVLQQDSEGLLNHRATEPDDPEPTQLTNIYDDPVNSLDPVEKHESIWSHVDGCRDIELSGMKLGTEQVGVQTL